MKSEVAVIIPVHNERERLIEAIRSIAEGNRVSSKFYIVDDASSDGTADQVEQYLKGNSLPYEVIRNEENHGAGYCRNIAFRLVKEKYTLFFDADDFVYPGMLDSAVQRAESLHTQLVLMEYERIFDINDKKLGMIGSDKMVFERIKSHSAGNIIPIGEHGYVVSLTNYPWNKLILTSYANEVGLHFSHTPVHNDVFAHWILLMNADRISVLHKPFCGHRVSPTADQITNISDERRMAMIDVFHELDEYFSNNIKLKERFYHFFVSFKIKLFKWALPRLDREYHQVFKESFSRTFFKMTKLELVRLSRKIPNTANEVMRFRLGIY